jgi:hypothetical protein
MSMFCDCGPSCYSSYCGQESNARQRNQLNRTLILVTESLHSPSFAVAISVFFFSRCAYKGLQEQFNSLFGSSAYEKRDPADSPETFDLRPPYFFPSPVQLPRSPGATVTMGIGRAYEVVCVCACHLFFYYW